MPFKKLNTPLKEALNRMEIDTPLPFQKMVLSKIKGGANVFGIAPKDSGKTTAMIISTIQRLNAAAFQDAPRAIIFVKDKKAALALEAKFKEYTRRTDLRVYAAYDEYNIEFQKEDIYYGVDIVIGTVKRLNKLYLINGINLGELQLLIVEDAEFLAKNNLHADIVRVSESLNKCQYLIFADKFHQRLERFQNAFMQNSQLIEI